MTDVRLTVEQARTIVETMELDMDEEETYQTESFAVYQTNQREHC